MTHTQFFTDSLAETIAAALHAAGVNLPVYGQINDPEAEHERVEIRVESSEEMIPGNMTARLDCTAAYVLGSAATTAEAAQERGAQVGSIVLATLRSIAPNTPLPPPPGYGSDTPAVLAKYIAAPFVILRIVTEPGTVETAGESYEMQLPFRAFMQF